MKILYYLSLFLLLFLTSCDNSTSSEPNQRKLEIIYNDNSVQELEKYLSDWNNKSVPVSVEEKQKLSNVERSIYEIYCKFYDPFNLNKYAGGQSRNPEVGNDYYSGLKYIIIQNNIKYTFNNDYEKGDSLINFRPDVTFPAVKVLYLHGTEKDELISFLNTEKHKEDLQKRFDFINSKLKIVSGHWLGWHFVTHPEIGNIDFNNNLDTAIISFRIRFEGGEAVFARSNNNWEMVSTKITWIE